MATASKPTVWTLDKILKAKVPVTVKVPLIIDPEWGEKLTEARAALRRAESQLRSARNDQTREQAAIDAEESRATVEALEAARDGKVIDFEFAGLNSSEYDAVVEANPPSAKQRADSNAKGQTMMWNPETFPVALIASCLVSPALTADEVDTLYHDPQWNQAEIAKLFQGALKACTTSFSDDD